MANTVAPISMARAKVHLKIDDDDDFEDSYIKQLILAAEEYCEQVMHQEIDAVYTKYGYMPNAVISFVLVVMTEMHKQRSLTSDRPVYIVPFYERLLDKYIDYSQGV